MYVVWYDTRNDLKSPGENVKIDLYCQKYTDPGLVFQDPAEVGDNVQLDDEAIDTYFLTNNRFLGDYIDMTVPPETSVPVVVYMGTQHPQFIPPGFGSQGDIPTPQENEAIFSIPINQ